MDRSGWSKSTHRAVTKGLSVLLITVNILKRMHPMISYADIYQLAGVVAVQATGGPNIDIMFGRKDSEDWTEEGRIPDYTGGAKELRRRFFVFIGLDYQDTVALAGAHTLGGVHGEEPRAFDNSYFQELLVEVPLDHALVADPVYRKFVDKYAQDKKLFFQHYLIAHKKLAEIAFILGFPEPPSSEPLIETNVLKKKKKSLTKKLSFLALLESLFLTVLDSCFHGRKSHAHTS